MTVPRRAATGNEPLSIQQLRHQRIDALADAGGGEGLADATAGGLEVEVVGDRDVSRDLFRFGVGSGISRGRCALRRSA